MAGKESIQSFQTLPGGPCGTIVASGIQVISLLALNDEGAPMFDRNHAAAFAALGIPAFACTPDLFPDLMAAAIQRQDITRWASQQGLTAQRAKG